MYIYVHVYMYMRRKNYKLSNLERCNCHLELDKCYLDEVTDFAVNMCQILSSDRSDQAGHNDTGVRCTA